MNCQRSSVIDPKDANIDTYVTRKALDGLYLVIAEQERAIRKDPVGSAGSAGRNLGGRQEPTAFVVTAR
jgi:hypothetical protein